MIMGAVWRVVNLTEQMPEQYDSLTAWTHRVPCQDVCLGCEILSCGHPPTLFGDLGSQHVEDASMSDYQTCHLFSKFL